MSLFSFRYRWIIDLKQQKPTLTALVGSEKVNDGFCQCTYLGDIEEIYQLIKDNMETSINETLAKGLATKIIREFHGHKIEPLGIDNYPRRKKLREAIKFFNKDPVHTVLAQMKPETSKWELLYGGWAPIFRSTFSLDASQSNAEYDKLGFDMDLDLVSGFYHRCIFFSLSKHGLERLILRKKPTIKHYVNASRYLNTIITPIIQQCLAFISDPKRKSNQLVASVDGLVFLIELSIGVNRFMKPTMSFHTITVMPEGYDGAQKLLGEYPSYELKPINHYWQFINEFVVGDAGFKLFLEQGITKSLV